jgi:hypothetical protein
MLMNLGKKDLYDKFGHLTTSAQREDAALLLLLDEWEPAKTAKDAYNALRPYASRIWDFLAPILGSMGVPTSILNVAESVRRVLPQELKCQPIRFDSVNTEYVAAMIAPELFTHQQPSSASLPTAMAGTRCTYAINTNSSGALGVYAFPYNACAANCLSILNNNAFDPIAGTQYTGSSPPTPSYISGPLVAQAAVIRMFKVTAFSMKIVDNLAALTKSGTATSIVFF